MQKSCNESCAGGLPEGSWTRPSVVKDLFLWLGISLVPGWILMGRPTTNSVLTSSLDEMGDIPRTAGVYGEGVVWSYVVRHDNHRIHRQGNLVWTVSRGTRTVTHPRSYLRTFLR